MLVIGSNGITRLVHDVCATEDTIYADWDRKPVGNGNERQSCKRGSLQLRNGNRGFHTPAMQSVDLLAVLMHN